MIAFLIAFLIALCVCFSLYVNGYIVTKSFNRFNAKLNANQADDVKSEGSTNDSNEAYNIENEPIFSMSYDPLEPPNQFTYERDLEDKLMERSLRFYDKSTIRKTETCYLVGLEDRSESYSAAASSNAGFASSDMNFSLEESLTELRLVTYHMLIKHMHIVCIPKMTQALLIIIYKYHSELAGAAGLTVVGSTYQRVLKPSIEYYIGQGKTKEISKTLLKLKCTCVIFDTGMSYFFLDLCNMKMSTIYTYVYHILNCLCYIHTLYYTIYT